MSIEQKKAEYESLMQMEKAARAKLESIVSKRDDVDEMVLTLKEAVQLAKREADNAMQLYLEDGISPKELTAVRQRADAADREHRDAVEIQASLKAEEDKQRQFIKEASEQTTLGRTSFWTVVSRAEQESILEEMGKVMIRAFVLDRRLNPGRSRVLTLPSFVERVFENLKFSMEAEQAACMELEQEYGIPLNR